MRVRDSVSNFVLALLGYAILDAIPSFYLSYNIDTNRFSVWYVDASKLPRKLEDFADAMSAKFSWNVLVKGGYNYHVSDKAGINAS